AVDEADRGLGGWAAFADGGAQFVGPGFLEGGGAERPGLAALVGDPVALGDDDLPTGLLVDAHDAGDDVAVDGDGGLVGGAQGGPRGLHGGIGSEGQSTVGGVGRVAGDEGELVGARGVGQCFGGA